MGMGSTFLYDGIFSLAQNDQHCAEPFPSNFLALAEPPGEMQLGGGRKWNVDSSDQPGESLQLGSHLDSHFPAFLGQ